jgi:ribonuclease VapC
MVVDSSAILAVLLAEEDEDRYLQKLSEASELWMSPVNHWEVLVRMQTVFGVAGPERVAEYLGKIPLEIVPVTAAQSQLAFEAFQRFGGRPARLNLGDCFAYALARAKDAPLLFKGNDFSATDVKVA